jgi:hypothetical protein
MKNIDQYGLRMSETLEHGTEYFNVMVMCLEGGNSFPTNPPYGPLSDYYQTVPKKVRGLCLDGLSIRSHLYRDIDDKPIWIGVEWCYRNVCSVDGRTAKAMAKTLAKIERETEKARESRRAAYYSGWEKDVAVAITGAVSALDLKWIASPTNPNVSSYSSTDWKFYGGDLLHLDVIEQMRNRIAAISGTKAA